MLARGLYAIGSVCVLLAVIFGILAIFDAGIVSMPTAIGLLVLGIIVIAVAYFMTGIRPPQ